MQPFILPYEKVFPAFGSKPSHAGEGSSVLGRATLGKNAWLGAFSVIRADGHFVRVGDDFHLGARSTLHIAHDVFPCIVGDRVAVGRNACVHACTVGSDVVIEDGGVILDGSAVEDEVVIAAGSTVFPGKRIAGGFLYSGSPAKAMRSLENGELARLREAMIRKEDGNAEPLRGSPAVNRAIDPTAFIAATATLEGQIIAAEHTGIWFSNVLDANGGAISIGARSNIQDNTIIRCSGAGRVEIGEETTVGHNVTMHDCTIGNRSLIGIGSVVAPGTIVGDNVLLAASARTVEGQILEAGWIWGGNPARQIGRLDRMKMEMIAEIAVHYVNYATEYRTAQMAAAH
jgi:carbonic anhydrase/acetyltransferase-like protein (isoleucine patch superfamily)